MEKQQQALAKKPDRTLSWFAPRNATEAWFFAEKFADSAVVPKALRKKPHDVFFVITQGAVMGMHPAEAVQKIHVVEGKTQLDATEIRARVQSHPDFLWSPDGSRRGCFELTAKCSRKVAEIEVRKWWWEESIFLEVTIEEAVESKWGLGFDPETKRFDQEWKPGSSWRKTPGDMLVARVTGRAARRYCPSFMAAVYTPEEMMDILTRQDAGEVIDLEPIVQQPGESKGAAFVRAAKQAELQSGEGAVIDATVAAALELAPLDGTSEPEPAATTSAEPEGAPAPDKAKISADQVKELAALCRRAKGGAKGANAMWDWLKGFAADGGFSDIADITVDELPTVTDAILKRLEDEKGKGEK